MKYACLYSIIRFRPLIETDEFANVGIVLLSPQIGYFEFKWTKNTSRFKTFFKPLSKEIYLSGMKDIAAELHRIKMLITRRYDLNAEFSKELFNNLSQYSEDTFYFSPTRVILTDNPREKIECLYQHYVERRFATPECIEKLDTKIYSILENIGVAQAYIRKNVTGNGVTMKIPFVHVDENGKERKIIQPLTFTERSPTQSANDGWALFGKMKMIRQAIAADILVTANPPQHDNKNAWVIFTDLENSFNNINIKFFKSNDIDSIQNFAMLQ